MRRAITAISFILCGASVLIFISALLIPLLRESPTRTEKGETETHELFGSSNNTIAGLEQDHTQSPAVNNDLQPPITPLQSEVVQNQSQELPAANQPVDASGLSSPIARNETANDRSQGESGVIQSPKISPEKVISQIKENSTEPVNPGAKDKRSRQHESMSLLVLGEGLFPVGEGTPKADLQETIDKIIPLINARSPDKVLVEGHADKWIPDGVSPAQVSKFNKIVSLQRASAVAKALEQKGVARDRIIVRGLGDAVPLASNRTNAGRAKNRRVEIKLLPTQ